MILRNVISLAILIIVVLGGCDRYRHYDQYRTMPSEAWHKDSIKTFEFQITDSLVIYNMFLNIRNTGRYPYSNLIVFVDTKMPGNKTLRDTLNCFLADDSGDWLGSGFGSIWTSKVPYKVQVRFPRNGKYKVKLQHGMRKEDLPGITDIGIRIEKSH